jgi:hypothetical protein
MSTTRLVVVPSVFQSSSPLVKSLAVKKRVLPTTVRFLGLELPSPGKMLATRLVVVPSVFQSSLPLLPSLAVKKRVLPTAVRSSG